MSASKRLSRVFSIQVIPLMKPRIVIMSDCHREMEAGATIFQITRICSCSTLSLLRKRIYHIELGDGDELWENRTIDDIISAHSDAFWLMSYYRIIVSICCMGTMISLRKTIIILRPNVIPIIVKTSLNIPLFQVSILLRELF